MDKERIVEVVSNDDFNLGDWISVTIQVKLFNKVFSFTWPPKKK